MKLLDRYIFRKFFSAFFLILVIIIVLIILIHATENAAFFRKHKLSFGTIVHYYTTLLPYMTNLLTPIIVFAATIWVTTRLAQRSEIIAILSSGVSFHRLAVPYFSIALLLTGANFYLTGWLLADANRERIKFDTKYLEMSFFVKTDALHLKVGADQYLYIQKYHGYNNTGYQVSLDTFQNATLVERLSAEKIRWNPTEKRWEFLSWKKRTFYPTHEVLQEGHTLALPLGVDPEDFVINPSLKEGLTLPELNAHIQKLKAKGDETIRLFIAEKHVRYMTPFAILILITLGFLIAVRKPRGGIGRQITWGFVLACLYISLFLSAKIVVEAQSEHPLLGIWMPNIIFGCLCIAFYRLLPK
ncbi:MAG TPA: LptF/LptG family permease [Amoebophilaceae bacterium]|jgi:lipopolysaccharide export system permease protein|nr:LptF/LptG family permease [Amoebophilaceae bacterium]